VNAFKTCHNTTQAATTRDGITCCCVSLSTAPKARVCLTKHREASAAAHARSVTGGAIPLNVPDLRSTVDVACIHGSSLPVHETLPTSGVVFGGLMSAVQPEWAEQGGAYQKTARLHHVESGKPSIVHLDSIHAPEGHIQGQRALAGSELLDRASTGSARSLGRHSVKKARRAECPGTQGKAFPAEMMVPADELPEQAMARDGGERTTVHT
jgi:hypothetical protein